MSLLSSLEKLRNDRTLIEALIDAPERLGPDFQPVRRLDDSSVVGYKATGAAQAGTEFDSALALLESAQGLGLVERLDWTFRCLAFDVAIDRGMQGTLFITPEPETYASACPPRLAGAFGRGRRSLAVAAEIPAVAFLDPASLRRGVEDFRAWGWSLVVDDVADDPSALALLDHLAPEYVKLDLDRPGRSIGDVAPGVRRMLDVATERGIAVLAIGVDTEPRRTVATQLGATLGRGRSLGLPAPLA